MVDRNGGHKKNVIWFLIDSVRNYHTNEDDRGRLDIMDEFSKESIEFTTAITSAPSTVMSVSSMMTGVPAVYQSRDYLDFKFNKEQLNSLPLILKKNGYSLYSIIFFPEGRRFLRTMFDNISESHWKGKYNQNEFWSNDIINKILQSVLEQKLKEPFFLYVNYNCRHDPQTSEKVKSGLSYIKQLGYYENSIFIMNSDHGYPDASRNISFIEKRKFGHDLIMTDDNILTPLFIKLPRINPLKINVPISTLDIMPTILDYLGFSDKTTNLKQCKIAGKSLLPLINNNNDYRTSIIRTDNRFIFQKNRVTSLRNDKYKFIHYYGLKEDDFFDIKNDPDEIENLIKDEEYLSVIDEFREELTIQNKAILSYHQNILYEKLTNIVSNKSSVLFIGDFSNSFIEIIFCILKEKAYTCKQSIPNLKLRKIINKLKNRFQGLNFCYVSIDNIKLDSMKVMYFPVSKNPLLNSQMKKAFSLLKQGKFTEHYICNFDFEQIDMPKHWSKILFGKFLKRLTMLKTEPLTLLTDMYIWIGKIIFTKK